MGRAIGIDLGTTNSCAAIIENGKPRVIEHKGGQKTIPSVFAIDKDGKRLVGQEAKQQASLNPTNTVAAAKRLRIDGDIVTIKGKRVLRDVAPLLTEDEADAYALALCGAAMRIMRVA